MIMFCIPCFLMLCQDGGAPPPIPLFSFMYKVRHLMEGLTIDAILMSCKKPDNGLKRITEFDIKIHY